MGSPVSKRWIGKLVRDLEEQGCRTRSATGGRTIVYPPAGGLITLHLTPSDVAYFRTMKTNIRNHGLEWPPDHGRLT
jgi:hypothetical protein